MGRHRGTSASEIDSLLEELFAAMGVATQAEAIAAALKRGLFNDAWPDEIMQSSRTPPQLSTI